MATKTKEAQKIKVANTEIVIGDKYEVVPKKDYEAPDGFQEFGTTKILHSGVKEVRGVSFDEQINLYDTGFDEDSESNNRLERGSKEVVIDTYNKIIKAPYEKKFRIDASSHNDSFWESYMYEIYKIGRAHV